MYFDGTKAVSPAYCGQQNTPDGGPWSIASVLLSASCILGLYDWFS